MLTIAHVLTSFDIGGAEKVALDLCGAQVAAGERVLAVSLEQPAGGALGAAFAGRGAEVIRVPKGEGLSPNLVLRLARMLRAERVDVVHTHNPLPLIYGAPAGRLAQAAVVHTKHGVNPASPRARFLRAAAARLVDRFVAVSADTAEAARAGRECRPGALQVIENGVRLEAFAPDPESRAEVRAELGIPAAAWVVGTVGRAAAPKNQALLLRAAAPLLGPDRRLVIVGDGPLLGELRRQAGGSDFAHLLGARLDVPRLLCAFDVFALSSITEGLPLVICEAMATALPIVATAVGGVAALIDDGRTGLLVPSGDETALRDALAGLAADRDRARELGARARETALARHSIERVAREYAGLYRSVRLRP